MANRTRPARKPSTLAGSEIVLQVLREEGVDAMFGIPGGVLVPFFDKLYDAVNEGWLRYYLTRHEQGAAHMADGYARATGRVGVCIATSGPGALNLVTGIATANMDSVPVVALTGQVRREVIGKDAFQEADIRGVTMPITKHNYLVKDPADLGDVMREAFHLARTGRPGAVLVDLPADVLTGTAGLTERRDGVLRGYHPPTEGDPDSLRRAAALINQAERPVLYVGGGAIASDASTALKKLVDKTGIPVVHTLMGKGAFPETHPLSLGMPGMHGAAYASRALNAADLIIGVGVRFDDRVTGDVSKFARGAGIVHIDVDPSELNKIIMPHVALAADARLALQALLPLVKKRDLGPWHQQVDAWKVDCPLCYPEPPEGIAPQYVIEELWRITRGQAVVTTEVGQNQMWAAQYYLADRPRQFLTSGGLGTMGYGFPAAIGAQVGCPEANVWDIAGDGSIQMNIQELATAIANKLPVKVAILNNGYLGMVRQWQTLFYHNRLSGTVLENGNPDFVALAKAYGAEGILVKEAEEVAPAIERANAIEDRPVLVDFRVWPMANVMPMIPAGKSVDDLIMEA
jgi:acetolactate synthase-1/2/3 large subunit